MFLNIIHDDGAAAHRAALRPSVAPGLNWNPDRPQGRRI
jgi:hypothetical protein